MEDWFRRKSYLPKNATLLVDRGVMGRPRELFLSRSPSLCFVDPHFGPIITTSACGRMPAQVTLSGDPN